jgi:PAS domain S-box-containing protein
MEHSSVFNKIKAMPAQAAAAEDSLALLREGFRRSNDVMFYCDADGVILDVNEAFVQRYGYSREEAVGQSPRILKSRHSTRELYERMWSSILTRGFWRGEMINRAKDGREIPLVLTITAVRDAAGRAIGYVSNAADMTERLELQARVADSEALASVGEMAAVVAHEIRNPLSSIVMAAKELAAGELGEEDRGTVLRVLRSESQRLNEALTNFLAFARPRPLRLERADLNALIDEVVRMVQADRELSGGVAVSLELSAALQPVQMDADQIRQVVWNLVINALQALGGKGELRVRTGRCGGHAFFEVADTGPGIPAAALKGLFKPFQTTKQKGTGLGLAIAARVAKAHGGTIAVETGERGTTFEVVLPSSGE